MLAYLARRSSLNKGRCDFNGRRHAASERDQQHRGDRGGMESSSCGVGERELRAESDPHVVKGGNSTTTDLYTVPSSQPRQIMIQNDIRYLVARKEYVCSCMKFPQRHANSQTAQVNKISEMHRIQYFHSMLIFIKPSLASVIPCRPTRLVPPA